MELMMYEIIATCCVAIIYVALKSYRETDDSIIEFKPDYMFTYINNKVSKL